MMEYESLAQALQSAYYNPAELEQLVFFGLGEKLDALTAPGPLPARIMALVQWAEAAGRLDALVRAAHERRPGNAKLHAFVQQYTPTVSTPQTQRILFLAASATVTDPPALDREARSIQKELEQAGHRDRFEFETRWAVAPLDMLRELRKLEPAIVHFSGRGGGQGLQLVTESGQVRDISPEALRQTFAAAGGSVRLVVLSSCYTEAYATALLSCVESVVGLDSSVSDSVSRSFAIGFYGGLGELESVEVAYRQGCAAVSFEDDSSRVRPQLRLREESDAGRRSFAAGRP